MGSVGAITDESKTFKQMVHTQVGNINKCLPESPPEAIPAAAAAQNKVDKYYFIESDTGHINLRE
jgi:hypothetical protein